MTCRPNCWAPLKATGVRTSDLSGNSGPLSHPAMTRTETDITPWDRAHPDRRTYDTDECAVVRRGTCRSPICEVRQPSSSSRRLSSRFRRSIRAAGDTLARSRGSSPGAMSPSARTLNPATRSPESATRTLNSEARTLDSSLTTGDSVARTCSSSLRAGDSSAVTGDSLHKIFRPDAAARLPESSAVRIPYNKKAVPRVTGGRRDVSLREGAV